MKRDPEGLEKIETMDDLVKVKIRKKWTKVEKATTLFDVTCECTKHEAKSLLCLWDARRLLCRSCAIKASGSALRTKQTMLERYGVSSSLSLRETHEKRKATLLKKYGSTAVPVDEEAKKRRAATFKERYGVGSELHVEYVERNRQRCFERHGVYHTAATKEASEKREATCLERYGFVTPLLNDEVHEKTKATLKERYGSERATLKFGTYVYDQKGFDSSWELAFYIYQRDRGHDVTRNEDKYLVYEAGGRRHKYYYDFVLDGRIVEVKGDHLLEGFLEAKGSCLDDVLVLTVKDVKPCLDYVRQTYGKGYLKSFLKKFRS